MKIPSKLKVGGHIVKVSMVDNIPDTNSACGLYNIKENHIFLDKNQVQTQLEASFLHEVFHSINILLPEEQIEFLSQSLYQILKDNKLLFDGVKNG